VSVVRIVGFVSTVRMLDAVGAIGLVARFVSRVKYTRGFPSARVGIVSIVSVVSIVNIVSIVSTVSIAVSIPEGSPPYDQAFVVRSASFAIVFPPSNASPAHWISSDLATDAAVAIEGWHLRPLHAQMRFVAICDRQRVIRHLLLLLLRTYH
jgi:hypothetical protein